MNTKKRLWGTVLAVLLACGILFAYKVYTTNLAHTTFDRYYAFRGCVQLVDKTDTYGDCLLAGGEEIRMVFINGKWYLEGDGPGVW